MIRDRSMLATAFVESGVVAHSGAAGELFEPPFRRPLALASGAEQAGEIPRLPLARARVAGEGLLLAPELRGVCDERAVDPGEADDLVQHLVVDDPLQEIARHAAAIE